MSSATDFQWKAAGLARLVGLGGPTVWKFPVQGLEWEDFNPASHTLGEEFGLEFGVLHG